MPEVKDETNDTPVVAPAKPVDLVSIILPTEFVTNDVTFPKGLNNVTPEVAEDLQARIAEHERIREFNMTPGDYTLRTASGNFDAAGK